MSHERQRRLMRLLDRALELSESERPAFLEQECADDSGLRDQILALLASPEGGDDALDRPAFSLHESAPPDLDDGRRLGPYRIVRLLERGGMGSVFLAEREDFEKQVALKIIRRGLDLDDLLVRRFHNERQILARLEHPHIARLLDGGTTEDRLPYFVMEYVDGVPVDRYCEEHGLSVEQRLGLFRKICDAVYFAHRNLVVHRDLKPGNVFIGADGEPKLLDFGIAKLLDDDLADRTVVTGTREGLMTPRYASPEQILGEPVGTASDIYSLGVLLYELLAGVGPYSVDPTRPDEMVKAVCYLEPKKPSTAVGRAENRTAEAARQLSKKLRGDLDNIVCKALEKAPEDRYGSARELSEDLRRHLAGLPISASTGSWTYRAGKLVRRRAVELTVVGTFLALALALGLYFARLAGEREVRALFVRGLLDPSALSDREMETLLQEGPEVIIRLPVDLQEGLSQEEREEREEKIRAQRAQWLEDWCDLFWKGEQRDETEVCLARYLETLEPESSTEYDIVLTAMGNFGARFYRVGDYKRYERYMEQIVTLREENGLQGVDNLKAKSNWATSMLMQGKLDDAKGLAEGVLEDRRELLLRKPKDRQVKANLASSLRQMASIHLVASELEQAQTYVLEARELEKTASAVDLLGRIHMARGDLEEAGALLREGLALAGSIPDEEHRKDRLGRSHLYLAELELLRGDRSAAEEHLWWSLFYLRDLPEGHWLLAAIESLRGEWLRTGGRSAEAAPLLKRSAERLREVRGAEAAVTRKAEERLRAVESAASEPD